MKYILGNWKMKMASQDILEWFDLWYSKSQGLELDRSKISTIIAPSHIYIPLTASMKKAGDPIGLAAQDISQYEKGAHTGEVGAFQISEFCQFSIIGHSERKEPESLVLHKRDVCIESGLVPIVCFTAPENAKNYVSKGTILAWEDPDNIAVDGVFLPKNPADIMRGVNIIRDIIGEDTILLYGGSVNRDNIKLLAKIEKLDGVLVGTASMNAEHFLDIIEAYL